MELAVAKLAISTLSPIINRLGSYVYGSNFGGDITGEEMRSFNDFARFKITELIRVVELDPSDRLTQLLDNLQTAAFEAEDLLDLYQYNQNKYQVSSSRNLIKNYVGKFKEKLAFMLPKSSLRISLENLLKFVDELERLHPFIKSGIELTQQNYKSTQASTSTPTTSTLSSPYFGRANQCDTIIEFLLFESYADSNRTKGVIPIIAIRGLGGSGKSLTAQRAYNDDKIKNYFNLRMWVQVTSSFDVSRLTKQMVECAKEDGCSQIDNLDVLQTILKESVSKRNKFLLVLDDVWCKDKDKTKWDLLLGPLYEVAGKGSKIIITTRLEDVASLHADKDITLEELKVEDCWSILKHYAFNNHEEIIEDQELENVGNQIIDKVKSSPLALKVAGSSLRSKRSVHEWQKILKLDLLKETMDLLFFSFQCLPSHLQQCFAYCSLFPKGYEFYLDYFGRKPLLVSLWIAQGFIENTSELTLEEEGSKYIEELVSYSFFEKHSNKHSNDSFIIHDLLHDLAEKVSKKWCHRIEHRDSLDIPTTCIHLSIHKMEELGSIDISDVLKDRNFRTLIVLSDDYLTNIFKEQNDIFRNLTNIFKKQNDIFRNLTKLRALYVQDERQMEVLGNPHVDKLKHLRYLNVHSDKKVPRSLAKLYHLQFFYLVTNQLVLRKHVFFDQLENLINLRTLKFYDELECNYLYYNSDMIEVSLNNVMAFHCEKDSVNGMMPLKSLPLLRGSLAILNLENVKSKEEAAEAMLNNKKNLNKLIFEWNSTPSCIDNSNTCEEVLEGLEPHPNLERLTIKGYQGVKVANWMIKENWLPHLQALILSSCKSFKEVPFLPPRLEELVVENCDELMQLAPVVKTLRILKLEDCPKLMPPSMSNMSLCLEELKIIRCSRNENQLFIELPFLTNLKHLELEGFPSLQTLPNSTNLEHLELDGFHSLQTLPNLSVKYLRIVDCPKLASLENLRYCTSLEIRKCPMLMRDEALLVEGVVEGDIAKPLSQVEFISTDEPLLILVLVQQQAFSSIKSLDLQGLQRPFPPLLEDHFHQLSSLEDLTLQDFTTLPNLEKLSSLWRLDIKNCHDVELLPNLPISLTYISVKECSKLKVNYEEGGRLHHTISQKPALTIVFK